MPSYFQNKQGQWVLKWKVFHGTKSTEKRIVSKKKSAIANKLRLAVDNLEQCTKTGVATNAEIDQWVEGFADLGAKKPLLSLEEACAIFEGYRDTRRRTGTQVAIDFDSIRKIYSDERLAKQRDRADTDNRSHRSTMNEYDRVLKWVQTEHPTLTTLTPDTYFDWWLNLRGQFASSTVNKRNYALRNFLTICVRKDMIAENHYPKDRCPVLKQITDTERRVLDFEEVDATIERIRREEDYYLNPFPRRGLDRDLEEARATNAAEHGNLSASYRGTVKTDKREAFLRALKKDLNVSKAAQEAGLKSTGSLYTERRYNSEFAERWRKIEDEVTEEYRCGRMNTGRSHPMHGSLPIAQMIALNTGIRTKEARWLEWDVCHLFDKKPSTMVIQRVKCKKTGHIGNVKTGEWRMIGINALLKEWLKKEKARQEKLNILGQFVIPSGRIDRPNGGGAPISDNQIGDSMLEFNQREHDIYKRPEWPTYYSYRHTFATNLLRSGKDLETVRERMGHISIATTQKYLRYINAEETTIENDLPWVN